MDESTFQQILQAAYVIQQQNDIQQVRTPKSDPAATLAVIVETQQLLHSRVHDLHAAAQLIVEQLGKITNATGIAIAVIANEELTYCAASGSCAALVGSTTPIAPAISEFLQKEEEALRRASNEFRPALPEKHDISPALFPVYHQGTIAGLLQVGFPAAQPLPQSEIRSCQVMAGLMGEVIARAAELEWKQTLASERATMLEALERLRPQLEHLAGEPENQDIDLAADAAPAAAPNSELTPKDWALPLIPPPAELAEAALQPALSETESKARPSSACSRCGFRFREDEKFCGRCGTPRIMEIASPAELPNNPEVGQPANGALKNFPVSEFVPVPEHLPGLPGNMPFPAAAQQAAMQFTDDFPATEGTAALAADAQPAREEIAADEETENKLAIVPEPEKPSASSPWSSARNARTWLESLRKTDSLWLARHSGDVSIVIAGIVLLLVLVGWNAHPPQSKLAHGKTPPPPSLTLFERMLVGLGLAEAPPAPVYMGNPNVQVWEDLHTGLYYCPGADLYGKTPGGKQTNQRDAQLDQFESAARKPCE